MESPEVLLHTNHFQITFLGANTEREYDEFEIMQMIGRAGRPQFDATGVVVIMTKNEKRERYEKLISGTEIVESW